MNKLTKILRGSRPVSRDAVAPLRSADPIPVQRRERLICIWSPDPNTGRLICTWHRPSGENGAATPDAGEPPPALEMAA